MAARWIERRFERLIWKFRLISIVPVVLTVDYTLSLHDAIPI